MSAIPVELIPGFELRPAWRLHDARVEADAAAFWRRTGILPPDVAPERRAKELICVAYKGDSVVGVHTATIERVNQVRARLAMLRSAVDPDVRRTRVSMAMTLYARALLERWSRDNPHERLAGMGAILESEQLAERGKEPWWPQTRFILAGFLADGRQLRISWFEDFRLDAERRVSPAAGPAARIPDRTRSGSGCPRTGRRGPWGSGLPQEQQHRTIP